ncbi:YdcF family protein [Leptospira ognonensis]|uniref:YdcF family protein n=1 Tax=Leptospira ognonensis TaxID=2484945 RepID=A0A4R9K4U6_9LEPT|nr:YdcF family protein [Leptospira ognonensis]TGL59348.1 YdcF family protein [Leptospira ognonensis]
MDPIFFFFSKVLSIFIYPFSLFFLLGIYALLKVKDRRSKFIFSSLLLFLYFFSNAFIAAKLVASLEKNYPPIEIETLPEVDVVVVLGGMIHTLAIHPGRPELTDASDRLVDAVRIYKAKKAKKILFTGGSGSLFAGEIREADLAEKIILGLGVPKSDLLLERESRNTRDNAVASANIIKTNHLSKMILVTSAFHMKRAEALFQKEGLDFINFPTDYKTPSFTNPALELWIPSPSYLEITSLAIKEWVGIFAYRIKGYL